jgi:hypothetical protein
MLCFPGAKRYKTARHNLRARTTSSNGKTDGRRHFVATFVKPNHTAAAQDNLDCNWTSNRPGGNYAFCCSASLGNWPFLRNYCTYFPPVGRTRCTVHSVHHPSPPRCNLITRSMHSTWDFIFAWFSLFNTSA